jgi:hypothetical protein
MIEPVWEPWRCADAVVFHPLREASSMDSRLTMQLAVRLNSSTRFNRRELDSSWFRRRVPSPPPSWIGELVGSPGPASRPLELSELLHLQALCTVGCWIQNFRSCARAAGHVHVCQRAFCWVTDWWLLICCPGYPVTRKLEVIYLRWELGT